MSRFFYSPTAWRVFSLAFAARMKMGVHAVKIAGPRGEVPCENPLLLVSNHVSWWDGFILRQVHRQLRPSSSFHPVMLEKELRKRPFLKALGALGLDPSSAMSFRALLKDLKARRIKDSSLTLLFFPQGKIWPSYRRPLGFAGGVRLVAQALAPATVLPMGLHLESGPHPAPTAFISLGEPIHVTEMGPDPARLESAVEEELRGIHDLLSRKGEEAPSAWPDLGSPLPGPLQTARTLS